MPLNIAANEISQKSDFNKFSLNAKRQFYKIKKCTLSKKFSSYSAALTLPLLNYIFLCH